MAPTIHVIGAGLAGLAAAVELAEAGRDVALYESAAHAGGRCRSYHDAALDCRIDNGNHLILSANHATLRYLSIIGGQDQVHLADEPRVDFLDLSTMERWAVRPHRSLLPFWLFDPARRVAGTRALDYLEALDLWRGRGPITARMATHSTLFRRLWAPLFIAVLNTPLDEADPKLMRHVLIEIFGRGGAGMIPALPKRGLSDALIDPAITSLVRQGVPIHYNHRLRRIGTAGDRIQTLEFSHRSIDLDAGDRVILAVPAQVAGELLPVIEVPRSFAAILNAHYRLDPPAHAPPLLGLIGGTAEWVFCKPGIVSITVSAADHLIDAEREVLAQRLWADVARAFGLGDTPMPAWQIVKEKRATFRANAAEIARRPGVRGPYANLALAGDYTDTGLPATIEGAIRSGRRAATFVMSGKLR